jgi:FKBP-type peptidyl-prolyl cis-trans isomerase FklB
MRKILITLILVFIAITGCSQTNSSKRAEMVSQTDSVSYAIGIDIGRNFKKQNIDITADILKQGIVDAMADTSYLTDNEIRSVMMNFQKTMAKKVQEKNKVDSEKNKAEADAFFKENKTKEGVVTLESGLQYKVLKSGKGKSPKLSSTVVTNYAGRLLDGTEFDSSYKRGTPFTTKITGVIKGWTEVLQLMKEGDKWEVYIPADLAYGERGSPPVIGPNQALIFTMELLEVK